MKLHRPDAKIIGVEPETACTMHRSLALGKPASMPEAKCDLDHFDHLNHLGHLGHLNHLIPQTYHRSIAAGLAPPFAGANAFQVVIDRPLFTFNLVFNTSLWLSMFQPMLIEWFWLQKSRSGTYCL